MNYDLNAITTAAMALWAFGPLALYFYAIVRDLAPGKG